MTALEVIEQLYDAIGRGDMEAAGALLHPAIRWIEPGGTEHRGHSAVERHLFRPRLEQWAAFSSRLDSFHEDGELVFARGAYVVQPHGVARELEVPFVWVYEVRSGRVEVCQQLSDTALLRDALEGRV